MASRILVLSASVGAGHLRAAEAVELVLRETVPDVSVENVDVLQLTNRLFRRLYARSYLDLVNHAPYLLGYLYDMLDRPSSSGKSRRGRLLLALEKLNLRKFIRHLKEKTPDLVINTHFLPAEIIASLRRDKQLKVRQVTATTDFDTHRLWVNQPCDHYFTATEEGARYLQYWGVPAEDISITGIPIHPVFAAAKDREALLAKHGFSNDRPIVLQLAGGFGVGPIARIYQALLDVPVPMQLVVIAGRNEKAKAELNRLLGPPRHRTRVLGFTTDIDEWMALADVVVTKPGGLTTSETLARGAVMVILNPTPGQETRNSDYLLENGAAVKVNNVALLSHKVTSLLENSQRLAQLKANIARLAKPRAAYEVVAKSLQFLKGAMPGTP